MILCSRCIVGAMEKQNPPEPDSTASANTDDDPRPTHGASGDILLQLTKQELDPRRDS